MTRPPYIFTELQQAAYNKLMKRVRDSMSASETDEDDYKDLDDQEALLDFLLALFNHVLDSDEYESTILSSLAVIGIRASDTRGDIQDTQWVSAEDHLVHYSAIIKVVRLLIVHQSTLQKEDQESQIQTGKAPTTFKPRLFQLVRDRVSQYASAASKETPPTPFDWILETKSYAMKIQFTSTTGSQVIWQGDQITVRGVSLTMSSLQHFVSDLNLELRRITASLLLLDPDSDLSVFPAINLHSLVDDVSNEAPGYSFAQDSRNRQDDPDMWIIQRILGDSDLRSQWLSGRGSSHNRLDQSLHFQPSAVSEYRNTLDSFRERLFVLLYLTSGQPARTSELQNLRYRNTPYGGSRNLFISRGRVCIKTWYHKGLFRTQSYKVILRFLPKEVSQHFVRFIQLILPFWQLVEGFTSNADTTSPFIWAQTLAYRAKDLDQAWASYGGKQVEMLWAPSRLQVKLPIPYL
jgi:hypothetical protein